MKIVIEISEEEAKELIGMSFGFTKPLNIEKIKHRKLMSEL